MAKNQTATAPAPAADVEEKIAAPTQSVDTWDNTAGESYGGDTPIVEIGEELGKHTTTVVAGPFTHQQVKNVLISGEPRQSWIASDADGQSYRMPLAATFVESCKAANLHPGDTYLVRRDPDQKKQTGKGAGKPMAMFAIKVTARANVTRGDEDPNR